jgi:TonB-linked SusC/RagA family outer membrane protein
MGMKKTLFFICLLILYASISWAQRQVTGQVLDNDNQAPLQAVSVMVKNSNVGTTTDANGRFELTVPSGATALVLSFAGFGTREVALEEGQGSYNLSLTRDVQSLNEVVVVAYGQQEKRKITGSISKLSGKQVENIPLTSVDQILQGKVAGLQSVATSGQPGAAQQIRIRGIGSISASSAPLFVIDGMPINTGDASNLTNSSNLLASLNPNDIESISVLKDASAASIYGSRAANGVILITTKKGRAGKTVIRADAEVGSNDIAYMPEMGKPLNKEEINELFREGLANAGFPSSTIDFVMNEIFGYNTSANYNWLDLVTRKGQQHQVNLSASGGDVKTQFFLSGGYFKQQSPVIGSDIKRFTSNVNLRHALSQRINVGLNLNLSSFNQRGEIESANFRNPIIAAMALLPTQEAFNDDGTPNYDPNVFTQIYNPLAIIQYDKQNNQTSKLLGSGTFEYRIIDNLKFTSRLGIDYNNLEEYLFYNPIFGDAASTSGYQANSYERLYNRVWTNFADYSFRTLAQKLDGTVTLGYEAQQSKAYTQSGDGNVVPKNGNVVYPAPAVPTTASVTGSDYSFTSLFSRAQVNFLDRYSLSGSLRRDGSSRFGANNRYGTFWSVGAAWNIDQEDFMLNAKLISSLKLRASYGVNGNAGIGNYDWRSIFLFTTTYNGASGSFQNSIGNNNLTWEQNKPFDVGLELGVLDNRISLEADYYIRKTENLLLNEPLSPTGGFTTYSNNVGAMENKGIELTLNANPIKTRDFNWTLSLNSAWNKNKVTRLRPGVEEIIGNPFTLKVGEDVQSYFVRQWAGADPATGDPLWYKDGSKNETTSDFSEASRVIRGSASPKGFGGLSTTLTYKFLSLDAQLNYQYGNYLFNQWDFLFISDGAFLGLNHSRRQLQRWQNPGDVTDVPRFEYANATASNEVSTRYQYRGDFVRLRNLTLGFDLPARLTQRAHLSSARIYVRGTNIWTKAFDENITIDPEQPIGGLSDLQFFNPKSYTVGLSIQL